MHEAELSMQQRLGTSESSILIAKGNLACAYQELGRLEEAVCLRQDVYSGDLRLYGEEHKETLIDSHNYANNLIRLERFGEVKQLLHKLLPVARRVLAEGDSTMLKMRKTYARALYRDPAVTLDDVRESVTTLEETERTARRVLGGAHPITEWIEADLREARAALRARETPSSSPGA